MSAPDVAAQLAGAGYNGLFLAGDSSRAGEVWDGGAARGALEEVVATPDFGDLERVLAAEVLYRFTDGPSGRRRARPTCTRARWRSPGRASR